LSRIDPGTGRATGPGGFAFDTLFAMVHLPISGEVASVRLRGEWALHGTIASAWRVEQRLREQAAAVADRDARLAVRDTELADRDARLRWHEQHERDVVADYEKLLRKQWEEISAEFGKEQAKRDAELARREADLHARNAAAMAAVQAEHRERTAALLARFDSVSAAFAEAESIRAAELNTLHARLDAMTKSRAWRAAERLSRWKSALARTFSPGR
jgi:hypothetical protein